MEPWSTINRSSKTDEDNATIWMRGVEWILKHCNSNFMQHWWKPKPKVWRRFKWTHLSVFIFTYYVHRMHAYEWIWTCSAGRYTCPRELHRIDSTGSIPQSQAYMPSASPDRPTRHTSSQCCLNWQQLPACLLGFMQRDSLLTLAFYKETHLCMTSVFLFMPLDSQHLSLIRIISRLHVLS